MLPFMQTVAYLPVYNLKLSLKVTRICNSGKNSYMERKVPSSTIPMDSGRQGLRVNNATHIYEIQAQR